MSTRGRPVPLPASLPAAESRPVKRCSETREAILRLVEYTPFPRTQSSQRQRVGFTRNVSASGLCLRANSVSPVGSLLRVMLRGIGGRPERESIGRVCWAQPTGDGSCWLGLSLLVQGSGTGPAAPPSDRAA